MATLPLQRQKEIDSLVESITLNTGLSYPENSLLDIATALGVKVIELKMDANINGAVQYENEEGIAEPVIVLNEDYSPERKAFTLAHELGHYMLHKGEMRFRLDKVDYSAEDGLKETEANYFAASLLVPKNRLVRYLNQTGETDLSKIAGYFAVSKPVIENRIKWLATN